MKRHAWCSIGGSYLSHPRARLGSNSEIPLLASFFYLFDEAEMAPSREPFSGWKGGCWPTPFTWLVSWHCYRCSLLDPCRRQCQVGSLAGAAHLLNDNAGVLR